MCKIDLNILILFYIFIMNEQFSSLSKDLTKKLSNNEKKSNGIYFTPKNIVIDMINICKKHNKKINRVLEPSCGSCQVINEIDKTYNNIQIDGIELNNTIFTEIKALEHVNNVNLMNQDYLEHLREKMRMEIREYIIT